MKKILIPSIMAIILTFSVGCGSINKKTENTSATKPSSTAKADTSSTVKAESTGQKVNASIGSEGGIAGDKITIPVKFDETPKKGIYGCDFNVKFDTKVLEVAEIVAGDIVTNAKDSFSYQIDSSTGLISFLYMDNSTGKDAIVKAGVFANINFTVKKDAVKGNTVVRLESVGAFIDESLKEHQVTFKDGSVTVK